MPKLVSWSRIINEISNLAVSVWPVGPSKLSKLEQFY
jgi:hypothetical protein